MAQPIITLRSVKGEALTWAEADDNFSNLKNAALPTGGTTGQVLIKNSNTDYDFAFSSSTGGLTALVDDTTPQLGGVLDTNGNAIEGYNTTITGSNSVVLQGGAADSIVLGGSTVNIKANSDNTKIALQENAGFGYITLTANGEITLTGGSIKLNNLTYPGADGTTGQILSTNGAGVLSWSTVSVDKALDDLTDVTITTAATNDVLTYTGSGWENASIPAPELSLSDLTNVTITSIATNDSLIWNGTAWVNSAVLGDIQAALTEIIG